MNYLAPVISVLTTFLIITAILSTRYGNKIQDIPNERSLHTTPTPRIGGVGIMAGMLSGWALIYTELVWWLLLPLIGLLIVSLLDDIHSLPVRQRLSAQFIAAAVLVGCSGLFSTQGIAAAAVVLLLTVWMTNLYNFMDGSDGLAGGMALFGFGMYGIAALIAHDEPFAMLNFSISAAALAFLFYNFPPAKIFMGDAGSIPLGFLVAAMGGWGWQKGHWAVWFPLLVFSPFVVDASVTLAKRTFRGAKITEAHRDHYYQRLIRMGWGHRNVALMEYTMMLLAGVSALLCSQQNRPWLLLIMWGGIYTMLMVILDQAWKRRRS